MKHLDTLEAIFTGCLQNEVSLTAILLALHNVCAHGSLIGDGVPGDKDLANLFEAFDSAIESAKRMEGC